MRRGAELVRYTNMLGDFADWEDHEEFQTLLWDSTPWDARVYRCAARRSIDWTLHANAHCQYCDNEVITGTRHYCMECGTNLCEVCVVSVSVRRWHSLNHHILRMHHYANSRQFALLTHKAVAILASALRQPDVLNTPGSRVSVQAPSPSSNETGPSTELPEHIEHEDSGLQLMTPAGPEVPQSWTHTNARAPEKPKEEGLSNRSGILRPPTGDKLEALYKVLSPKLKTIIGWAPSIVSKVSPIVEEDLGDESDNGFESSDEADEDEDEGPNPELCICCRGITRQRYWACLDCTEHSNLHIRICEPCEAKPRSHFLGERFSSPVHHPYHSLVRVDVDHPWGDNAARPVNH
ncbi:hypothetical protein B0H15DRAFT_497479 [Mycena belliarum]|uniref:B box-type domain-containing protein n=1 Tax=Mycena belliarum TaxID=1033014 RepID=A0AAD6XJP9_9AGAR|nr:hypothetical protein B0H15DRAFT_497479 [Mycena belliae]